ncbi:MAG: hypothetical protein RJA70_153, partial [Pseudomonadota bacterium]
MNERSRKCTMAARKTLAIRCALRTESPQSFGSVTTAEGSVASRVVAVRDQSQNRSEDDMKQKIPLCEHGHLSSLSDQRPPCGHQAPKWPSGLAVGAALCVCVICASPAAAQEAPPPAPAETPETVLSDPAPSAAIAVTPPRVVLSSEATYPPAALAARQQARVELLVTVLASGSVGEVSVSTSGGQDFDAAAVSAVRNWQFEPARRGDQAVDSRTRIPFEFSLPPPPPPPPRP